MKALRRFTVRVHLPDRLAALNQLSTNLRWSWEKPTQDLFATIDPELWSKCGKDPVAVLGAVKPARLDRSSDTCMALKLLLPLFCFSSTLLKVASGRVPVSGLMVFTKLRLNWWWAFEPT